MKILKLIKSKEMSVNDVEIFFKYWSVNSIPIPKEVKYPIPGTPSLDLDWSCPLCKREFKFSQMKCVTLEDVSHNKYLLPLCDNCTSEIEKNISLNDDAERLLVDISK